MSAGEGSSSSSLAQRRFDTNRLDYQNYLLLIQRVQRELQEDVDEAQLQEGWDAATQQGIAAWADDRDSIFRFLRVCSIFFAPDKFLIQLL